MRAPFFDVAPFCPEIPHISSCLLELPLVDAT
jgi:hypothetical protein